MADRRDAFDVAVTGATGTVGRGLLPLLDGDPAIRRVVAVARREFDPAAAGHSKVEYVQADVRDEEALLRALRGVRVVVHLAFSLYGIRQDEATLHRINVSGTLATFRAAVAAGARRFVYASSGAVYGFHPDNPRPIAEDAPLRPSRRHFYSRHKGAVERALGRALARRPEMEGVFFRPCAIVGPDAAGAAAHAWPSPLTAALRHALGSAAAVGLRPWVPGPPVPLQFLHQDDAGQAFHLAVTADSARGAFNLAGDGTVAGRDVPRTVGLRTLPVPRRLTHAALKATALVPPIVPGLAWSEVLMHPLVLDTRRAKRELGWRPRHDSGAALAATREMLGV